ncbi:MAG: DNA-binding protein [Nitrospiraceae bacterium]|nr:DNA-binding protein [Nitrospiraceae bacterium]|tara:strand:- start:77 stop:358 length:282 start_codon:yes stop_codon:yes gene_type:complete
MAKPMSKAAIISHLAKEANISKKAMSAFLENLASLSYKSAKNGFTIPNIGKLVVVNRKARTGRNPQTGEAIEIPAKSVLKFRVSKVCKDAVLG